MDSETEALRKEFDNFKAEFDAWIKSTNSRISNLLDYRDKVDELDGNIQHNYELIKEIRDDMEAVREEIKLLKMIQIKLIGKKLKV